MVWAIFGPLMFAYCSGAIHTPVSAGQHYSIPATCAVREMALFALHPVAASAFYGNGDAVHPSEFCGDDGAPLQH